MFIDRQITKKQWETMRTYAKQWDRHKEMFVEEPTEYEKEYKDRILRGYQVGIVTHWKENN
jgi:hypothetical protein